jgi:site-specific recombinase XerD
VSCDGWASLSQTQCVVGRNRAARRRVKHQGKKQCLGWTNACQKALADIDLHWHDLRHEGACRLLRSGVNIRTIQLMLGHTTLQQTQKHLNVTDDELKRDMQLHWEGRRERLRLLQGGKIATTA